MISPLFSVSVICKNEEGSIPNLHNSLKEFINAGGDVTFVDTGSTDNTIQVLKGLGYSCSTKSSNKLRYIEAGSRFIIDLSNEIDGINKEFIAEGDELFTLENTKLKVFDFCSARRFAGSCCKKSWVLSVDCDEVFSALNIEAINQVIISGMFNQVSFTFRYRDYNGNASQITSRDKLYNRGEADWKWLVHEQVKTLDGFEEKIAHLPENILALDHYQHEAEHRSNYLLSMCVDVMKDPNDQHIFWLGREFQNRGYHGSAVKLLGRYLREYPKAWSAERCLAGVYMGDAYIDLSKKDTDDALRKNKEMEAMKCYYGATIDEPTFREPWLRLGYWYVSKSQHDLAILFLTAALNIKSVNRNYMNDTGYCYGYLPYQKLYISLFAVGNKSASHEIWKKAKLHFPNEKSIADHEVLFSF